MRRGHGAAGPGPDQRRHGTSPSVYVVAPVLRLEGRQGRRYPSSRETVAWSGHDRPSIETVAWSGHDRPSSETVAWSGYVLVSMETAAILSTNH